MRFAGQGYEVVTALPGGPYTPQTEPAIRAAFEHAYETVFGRRPPVAEIEIINIRVALTAATGRGELNLGLAAGDGTPAPRTTRSVRFSAAQTHDTPVYERASLPPGTHLDGPAIIEEASSTLLVPPRAVATVDACGNILIDLASG